MDYIKTWKAVILRPSDFYRRMSTTGGYADPLTFVAISLITNVLLRALVSSIMLKLGVRSRMLTFGGMYDSRLNFSIFSNVIIPFIIGIVSLFIMALILNFLYKALGGTGSYEGTMRLISYAYAPKVFSLIPILGLITGIYELYLLIIGGMVVHNVSMKKSAVAVLLPMILIFLLFLMVGVAIVLFGLANFLHGYFSLR
jgi:hypothetical protein